MPLDYDEIEKGRRRNWDKLLEPEERKRREREQLEKETEEKRGKSSPRKRREAQRKREETESAEWLEARRRLVRIISVAVGVVALILAIQWTVGMLGRSAFKDKKKDLIERSEQNLAYARFSEPLEAWASWRNAWVRKDAEAVVRTYSEGLAKRKRGGMTNEQYASKLQTDIRQGRTKPFESVAELYDSFQVIQRADNSPRDGALTVFKSAPISPEGIIGGPNPWIVALSWSKEFGEWRVADVRQSDTWRDSWSHESQIDPNLVPRKKTD